MLLLDMLEAKRTSTDLSVPHVSTPDIYPAMPVLTRPIDACAYVTAYTVAWFTTDSVGVGQSWEVQA